MHKIIFNTNTFLQYSKYTVKMKHLFIIITTHIRWLSKTPQSIIFLQNCWTEITTKIKQSLNELSVIFLYNLNIYIILFVWPLIFVLHLWPFLLNIPVLKCTSCCPVYICIIKFNTPVRLHLSDKAHTAVAHPHREPLGTRDKLEYSLPVPDPHIGPVTITSQTGKNKNHPGYSTN